MLFIVLIRLFLFYLLFRFLFKGISSLIRFSRHQPHNYDKGHKEPGKNTPDDKNIVDVEFKEID